MNETHIEGATMTLNGPMTIYDVIGYLAIGILAVYLFFVLVPKMIERVGDRRLAARLKEKPDPKGQP
jgi:glycopeptide antibiotics resistance protein